MDFDTERSGQGDVVREDDSSRRVSGTQEAMKVGLLAVFIFISVFHPLGLLKYLLLPLSVLLPQVWGRSN